MTAILSPPPLTGERWQLVDWVEFKALCNEFGICRLTTLIRIHDESYEEENSDFAEQDAMSERILEKLNEELNARVEKLGTAYPFTLEDDQSTLALKDNSNITNGGYTYLYCLFFSHINSSEVISQSPPVDNEIRDYMQICATVAAAGIINGNAISFGHPRPNGLGFLDALRRTYQLIGEGAVRENPLLGSPIYTKDGEVDLIAWQETIDRTPGMSYMLAQVASGTNWQGKSIKGSIDTFHRTWFSEHPPSTPRPAMFIPFCIDLKPAKNSVEAREATLSQKMTILVYDFGEIYYRYNMPAYVDMGFNLLQENPNLHIERHDEFHKIIDYVNKFKQILAPTD